jgi:hypothetical protein
VDPSARQEVQVLRAETGFEDEEGEVVGWSFCVGGGCRGFLVGGEGGMGERRGRGGEGAVRGWGAFDGLVEAGFGGGHFGGYCDGSGAMDECEAGRW